MNGSFVPMDDVPPCMNGRTGFLGGRALPGH